MRQLTAEITEIAKLCGAIVQYPDEIVNAFLAR